MSDAARSLINGVLPMASRKPDRTFIAGPIPCFSLPCFWTDGNFNGVCADLGNFFVAWHACSVRHPFAGDNLRSSSDQGKVIRLSLRANDIRSSRNTRSPLATRTNLRAPRPSPKDVAKNRWASRIMRPERVRGRSIITPRRSSSPHLHRPWCAIVRFCMK